MYPELVLVLSLAADAKYNLKNRAFSVLVKSHNNGNKYMVLQHCRECLSLEIFGTLAVVFTVATL